MDVIHVCLDTSMLIKRYVKEENSALADRGLNAAARKLGIETAL